MIDLTSFDPEEHYPKIRESLRGNALKRLYDSQVDYRIKFNIDAAYGDYEPMPHRSLQCRFRGTEPLEFPACGCANPPTAWNCFNDQISTSRCVTDGDARIRETAHDHGYAICADCDSREALRWAVAVTTAPRPEMTLERTLRSLASAGWQNPWICAEPDTPLPDLADGCLIQRSEKLGPWKNWQQTLQHLVEQDADVCMIVQDDAVFQKRAKQWVETYPWPLNAGVVSLYCPRSYGGPKGWNLIVRGGGLVGALAFVFSIEAAKRLLAHPYVTGYEQNASIDHVVGHWAREAQLPVYYLSPSLVQHIGEESSFRVGERADTESNRASANFTGENMDAFGQELPKTIASLTVIMTMWKRPQSFLHQLSALRKQTVGYEQLWIFVNDPDAKKLALARKAKPDRIITCDPNSGVQLRFACAMEARTEYVCVLDDDAVPGYRWFANCLDTMRRTPGILGTNGARWKSLDSYTDRDLHGWQQPCEQTEMTDCVGQVWFLRPEWIRYLFSEPIPHPRNGEDLLLSMRAKRLGGIDTFVPPHPADKKSFWGNSAGQLYNADQRATYRTDGFAQQRMEMITAEHDAGWQPLFVGSATQYRAALIDLLRPLNPSGGVEVGVFKGETSRALLEAFPGLQLLWMVDPWKPYHGNDFLDGHTQQMFDYYRQCAEQTTIEFADRRIVMVQDSLAATDHFIDGSLDFAILDPDHRFESVEQDLIAWLPKVRSGGYLCGHDYGHPNRAWGVKRAVDQFAKHRGLSVETAPPLIWKIVVDQR